MKKERNRFPDPRLTNPVLSEKDVREWWKRQIDIVNKPIGSATKGAEDGIQQEQSARADVDQQEKQIEGSTLPRYHVYDAR